MNHPYETSQKRRLVDLVFILSSKLKRPVSSADLLKHFIQFPDSRPILTQRIGQILIKAARPCKPPNSRIFPVGTHGHHLFYAPSIDPIWKFRFHQFILCDQIRTLQNFPLSISYLTNGPSDALYKNAEAGWVLEMRTLLQQSENVEGLTDLSAHLDYVRSLTTVPFQYTVPSDLIARPEAEHLLMYQIRSRSPARQAFNIKLARYLTPVSWPQSSLYPSQGTCYSKRQLLAFIVSQWPLPEENSQEAQSIFLALRYPI